MAEKKTKTGLEKIEKLIVDGQKEVIGRIDKLEDRFIGLEGRVDNVESSLRQEIGKVHSSLKNETSTTAKMLDYDIKEVGRPG
ncbi:MAG: hypothetical protein U9R38_06820 [Candidatus Margulisiibacteriota bacterium]|nr:hypothetical protein [Candidatus Margulisiibacteriota bacterium]